MIRFNFELVPSRNFEVNGATVYNLMD